MIMIRISVSSRSCVEVRGRSSRK